jgi:hypothetical protein
MADKDPIKEQIESAITDPNVPNIYCNGFVVTLGTGDILLILKRHDKAIANVSLSYSVAKTLAERLGGMISHLEGKTERTILTTDQLRESLQGGDENE